MRGFVDALQFLTIFPVGPKLSFNKNKLPQAIAYFPLVGLLLGLILAAANQFFLLMRINEFVISVILVILLVIFTGGLHLDGLADTFDALASGKERQKMLEIMKDPHIGTMGILSLICVILLKISFLHSLNAQTLNTSLILMCLLSRYSLVLAIFSFRYAREEGKAKIFVNNKQQKTLLWATAITLFCASILWGLKGLVLLVAVGIFAFLTGKLLTKKFGGITGDTLGAINELAEVFVLFNIIIFGGV